MWNRWARRIPAKDHLGAPQLASPYDAAMVNERSAAVFESNVRRLRAVVAFVITWPALR